MREAWRKGGRGQRDSGGYDEQVAGQPQANTVSPMPETPNCPNSILGCCGFQRTPGLQQRGGLYTLIPFVSAGHYLQQINWSSKRTFRCKTETSDPQAMRRVCWHDQALQPHPSDNAPVVSPMYGAASDRQQAERMRDVRWISAVRRPRSALGQPAACASSACKRTMLSEALLKPACAS